MLNNPLLELEFCSVYFEANQVNSSTIIEKNDLIYMVVETDHLTDVLKEFGHEEIIAKKVVIIGGGNIGFSLAQFIENSNSDINTERNHQA